LDKGKLFGNVVIVVDGGGEGAENVGSSEEGLPRIAERMEYSMLAACDPKGYEGS
jgi:hypothetical protein